MSHKHESCTAYGWGIECTEGRLTGECGHENCNDVYCSDLGHCECLCHSGKTCGCGYAWPRMAKSSPSAPVDITPNVEYTADPVTTTGGVPLMTRDWIELLGQQYKRIRNVNTDELHQPD